jgi:hypothetical protein
MRRVPHSYRCRSFSTVASSAVCVHQDGINSSIRECVEGQFVLARRSVCIERRPLEVFRSLDGRSQANGKDGEMRTSRFLVSAQVGDRASPLPSF